MGGSKTTTFDATSEVDSHRARMFEADTSAYYIDGQSPLCWDRVEDARAVAFKRTGTTHRSKAFFRGICLRNRTLSQPASLHPQYATQSAKAGEKSKQARGFGDGGASYDDIVQVAVVHRAIELPIESELQSR
jgi:hypothetical protein